MTQQPRIWIIGNSVQDLTVDLDLRRLEPDNPHISELIFFKTDDPRPRIRLGTHILPTDAGKPIEPGFQVFLKSSTPDPDDASYYILAGGNKYTLDTPTDEAQVAAAGLPPIRTPLTSLTWAGGGINVVNTIRALSPATATAVHYSDIGRPISHESDAVRNLKGVLADMLRDAVLPNLGQLALMSEETSEAPMRNPQEQPQITTLLRAIAGQDADRVIDILLKLGVDFIRTTGGENYYRRLTAAVNTYTNQSHLQVYLQHNQVDFGFYRSERWRPIQNLVFSGIADELNEVRNKIILRGIRQNLAVDEEPAVLKSLEDESRAAYFPVVMLNTIYDDVFFDAAFKLIEELKSRSPTGLNLVFAMTEHMMQRLKITNLPAMKILLDGSTLIFNEREFAMYLRQVVGEDATQFAQDVEQRRPPERGVLVKLVKALLEKIGIRAEIYVTLGPYGSLGILPWGEIMYVGTYSVTGRRIYDTTGCGDAYAAVVTLLKHHRRMRPEGLIGGHVREERRAQEEMFHAMAWATAAAYSKATSPVGRVYAADVIDLVRTRYVPQAWTARVGDDRQVEGRLQEPEWARRIQYTGAFQEIIKV